MCLELTRANNDSPSSNLKYLILKQKLLLGNPTDFRDLVNINELSINFDLQVKYCDEMTWYCQILHLSWLETQNLWDKYI